MDDNKPMNMMTTTNIPQDHTSENNLMSSTNAMDMMVSFDINL